ncbi:MAG: FtsL-like putative cell division protein [Prevotella sp.]|nr:FtsL-like putative cell division protein [Prevotella sp.]
MKDKQQEQIAAAQASATEQKIEETIEIIRASVTEEESRPAATLTLKKVIGGDILTAAMVRSQLWLFVLIVGFTVVYVAFRYQCQQDMILIDKLEKKLKDAKYRALASSSELTERCRESHVLELLKTNKDSTIQVADQPPYIIKIDGKR